MASSGGSYSSQSYGYAPTAPSLPGTYGQQPQPPLAVPYGSSSAAPPSSYSYGQPPPPQPGYGQYPPASYGQAPGYGPPSSFPPGTNPEVIRSFEMVDMDRSGFIDERELQQALSSGYQSFSMGTIRLLMFLFKNPHDPYNKVGPKEFAELWKCLGEWRGIFERFDRDRSGKINLMELRDALYSMGYAVPQSVLQLLISKYDDGTGRKELPFDSFIECGLIVKGLTEKFKEKDTGYTGKATLSYETFMTMVIPFLVSSK